MSEPYLTLDEIIATLRENFNVVGDEPWVTGLAKSAHSKNITAADWNSVLLKIAATVSATETLKTSLYELIRTVSNDTQTIMQNATLAVSLAQYSNTIASMLRQELQALEQKTSDLENSLNTPVVPDQGNRNDVPFAQGTPGVVALYNRSSGLELRELTSDAGVNYGPRLHVACATTGEIDSGNQNNPIAINNFAYAMKKKSYQGSLDSVSDADKKLPPSAEVVKNALSAMGFKVKLKILSSGQSFTLPPSSFVLVAPYTAQFKGTPEYNGDPSTIDLSGVSFLWVTEKLGTDMTANANGAYYRCMILTPSGISLSSKHYLYRTGCQIYNNHSSGKTYIYYVTA